MIVAPRIRLLVPSTIIRTYFPNLDELSFRTVLAFPNASNTGLHAKIHSSILRFGMDYLPASN